MAHSTPTSRRRLGSTVCRVVALACLLFVASGCIFSDTGGGDGEDTGWTPPEDVHSDTVDTAADTADAGSGDTAPPDDTVTPDDADDATETGDTDSVTPQTLEAPSALTFDWPGVGETATEQFELRNTGDRSLEVNDIDLQESGDDEQELSLQSDSDIAPQTLLPGETHLVTVEYTPLNTTEDSGTIVISADDPSLDGGTADIPLELPSSSPAIGLPQAVKFGRVPVNQTTHEAFTVENTGEAALTIDDVGLSGDASFEVAFFDPDNPGDPSNDMPARTNLWPNPTVAETLEPGDEIGIRVWVTIPNSDPQTGELTIVSNAPDEPEATVELTANSNSACLGLSHAQKIDFQTASTGDTSTKTVTVENCRPQGSDLKIQSLAITDDGGGVFALDQSTLPSELQNGRTLTINGNDTVNFVVTFSPPANQRYTGELTIESNDPSRQTHTIQLVGEGSNTNSCPTADAKGKVQGTSGWSTSIQTDPLETIQLTGTDSQDSDGSIQRYEWSIIERPADSYARLTPSSSVEKPELFVDLAGDYKVELVVYDDDGAASCGSRAIVNIDATPDEDVYLELVWNTPSDSDQTDQNGADMDLHYRNTGPSDSKWNEKDWDCFWHNKNPDWGTQGDSSDDPDMVKDDADGAGPEIIYHDNPASGTTYKVGAYYYDDNGFGPSYVTLRIYDKGTLRSEQKNKHLGSTFDFWLGAEFTGQPTSVHKIDQTNSGGFP